MKPKLIATLLDAWIEATDLDWTLDDLLDATGIEPTGIPEDDLEALVDWIEDATHQLVAIGPFGEGE
jgi:hypothetical protein